jgi:phenylpropionate dioxygenase-like ring-hydroxylating dioxygenase large terminal subunit
MSQVADRHHAVRATPRGGFVRNAWYVIAWSDGVRDKPLGRRVLDEPVVVFRDADGRAIAIGNRCPHRFAPLDRGVVDARGTIQCPYHGLKFDATGACVENPHGRGAIPAAARVPAYPLVERDRLLWIWMGDPARADAAAIPDYHFLAQPDRYANNLGNYLSIRADYQLMTDNLMDLSHLTYVHGADPGLVHGAELDVTQDGTTVFSRRTSRFARAFEGVGSSSDIGRHFKADDALEHWMDMRWSAPSSLMLEIGWGIAEHPRAEALITYATHILTPETAGSTHYFFGTSRAYDIENADATERQRAWQHRAFRDEDEPMLAACQEMIGDADFWSLQPIILASDTGAIRARKVLGSLIEAEAS